MWTKLAHEGLSGGVWAVDKLIANKVSALSIDMCIARLTRIIAASREDTA